MRATFALLPGYEVYNIIRKLTLEAHRTYHIGLASGQLPPHVSLKQPFSIPSLDAIEAYFDQLAGSIAPVMLTFPRIGGPEDGSVLWLEVEETAVLRELHNRINRELAERFPNTQAAFDGPAYHFHLTIAIGGTSSSTYRAIRAEFAKRDITLQALARHLLLFYYDDDQTLPGNFLTYKILPLENS